jgi:hypothetical protein
MTISTWHPLSSRWAISLILSVYTNISCYLGRVFGKILIGADGLDFIRNLFDDLDEFGGFGRGDPGKVDAILLDAHMGRQVFKQGKFSTGVVITFQVMAFTGVSPGHPDGVRPLPQGCQCELGTHSAGAGDADDADIGRVFHTTYPGKIRRTVTAPVTQEGYDFGFPWCRHVFTPLWKKVMVA